MTYVYVKLPSVISFPISKCGSVKAPAKGPGEEREQACGFVFN